MAKAIMVQGTMSNAGKSFLVAGLLRVFVQDGFKAVPFKSQNMSLNSFITKDGYEMGRAQVMQAEAAGMEPDVRMNPILLKPTTEMGSQIIVNGVSIGNMQAVDYFEYKKELKNDVLKAYTSLAQDNDIIVIEGAGSPAEINLKQDDIVNMGMAKMADAPVLLAGDIDRGGVFAQLFGTVMLLEEEEKERIKGIIINKFRGDIKILKPGLKMLEKKINIPTIGVVPYINIDIDDEDSLSDVLNKTEIAGEIDVAVIKLPKLSNFTDFNALGYIEGVSVRYVKKVNELKNPDIIIIPGTKNTMADLKWLRQCGLENIIIKLSQKGTLILGICGGFQMLGNTLSDPYNVEGGGEINGMGLLPIDTVFSSTKTTNQAKGKFENIEGEFFPLSGLEFTGYEIHMGESKRSSGTCLTQISVNGTTKEDGAYYKNIAGTYVHGIFDSGEGAKSLISLICKRKGIKMKDIGNFNLAEYKNSQYDILADTIRQNIDMDKIYKIMGIER